MEDIIRIEIQPDFETPDHAGTTGFQAISVIGCNEEGKEIDLTNRADVGKIYESEEILVKALGLDVDKIDIEFV